MFKIDTTSIVEKAVESEKKINFYKRRFEFLRSAKGVEKAETEFENVKNYVESIVGDIDKAVQYNVRFEVFEEGNSFQYPSYRIRKLNFGFSFNERQNTEPFWFCEFCNTYSNTLRPIDERPSALHAGPVNILPNCSLSFGVDVEESNFNIVWTMQDKSYDSLEVAEKIVESAIEKYEVVSIRRNMI